MVKCGLNSQELFTELEQIETLTNGEKKLIADLIVRNNQSIKDYIDNLTDKSVKHADTFNKALQDMRRSGRL